MKICRKSTFKSQKITKTQRKRYKNYNNKISKKTDKTKLLINHSTVKEDNAP